MMSFSLPSNELPVSFSDICNALRRNDPSMFQVNAYPGSGFPRGYGASLGAALREGGNSPLQYMTLQLSMLLDLSDTTTDNVTSLVQFIRESRDLRSVSLKTNVWFMTPAAERVAERRLLPLVIVLARQLILAIAQNPTIKAVELSFGNELYMPMTEFISLLGSSISSIERFILHSANFPSVAAAPAPLQEPLHSAVLGNKSIQHMMISLSGRTTIPETVLLSMGHHSRLRELYVSCVDGFDLPSSTIKALASLLRTTTTLEELDVSCPLSSRAAMEYLVEGLHANQTIHTLSSSSPGCIALDARQVLINYMQSPVQGHSPRRLRVADSDGYSFWMESGSFVVALFPTTPTAAEGSNEPARPTNTVGSALQVLELAGHDDRVHFFHALTAHAERIRLPCLEFLSFREVTCPLLHNCLSRLVHVRKLVLPRFMVYPGEASEFVRAMKANYSICYVSINFGNVEDSPVTHHYQRLVQAYCQRNAALQTLSLSSNNTNSNLVHHVNQVPNVFGTALQVPSMTHNAMIKALVALDQRLVGRDNRSERARLAAPESLPANGRMNTKRKRPSTKKEPSHNMNLRSRASNEGAASVPCQSASPERRASLRKRRKTRTRR